MLSIAEHFVLATTLVALLSAGCRPQADDKAQATGGTAKDQKSVVVFAAASLKDVLGQIATEFEKSESIRVDLSFGPSNQLGIQILEGAPADIFIAADAEWARKLSDAGAVAEVKQRFGNRLAMVVPTGDNATTGPKSIHEPHDLLNAAVGKVGLAGENVPAGKFAEQTLRKLGIYSQMIESGRVVRGSDVRTVLAYVERGEVDVGLVYATDAKASKLVAQVHIFEDGLHDPIVYPMALLKRSASNETARRFFAFLNGPQSRAAFKSAGFIILDEHNP
ncbi:MAG: molybdate ABC transporter substrate-binding protein [Planctomycetes bacterium]|nr:molybdate ABC transporter substrate-binding protein [Planctomycetota bacterium]MBI3832891.1 molybdate ABC transporter substrate-binding protein [Planctomycetota bacterium]